MSASIIKNLITPAIRQAIEKVGRNTAAQNRAIKNAAEKADMTPTEFKKKAKQVLKEDTNTKKPTKKPTNKKQPTVKRTAAQNKELKKLIAQQQKEMGEGSQNILPRRRATGPKGQEVQQGPLLSKVKLPEKMSPARKRSLIAQGKAKMTPKGMEDTGEFAPSAGSIAEEMGLGGKGSLPTEEQLRGMGGFEIKKYGGKVKRRMGGKVRGYGKAQRGY